MFLTYPFYPHSVVTVTKGHLPCYDPSWFHLLPPTSLDCMSLCLCHQSPCLPLLTYLFLSCFYKRASYNSLGISLKFDNILEKLIFANSSLCRYGHALPYHMHMFTAFWFLYYKLVLKNRSPLYTTRIIKILKPDNTLDSHSILAAVL